MDYYHRPRQLAKTNMAAMTSVAPNPPWSIKLKYTGHSNKQSRSFLPSGLIITAMGLLYFFETNIEFREMNPHHLFKRWLDIVEALTEYPTTTTGVEIKQLWKVRLLASSVLAQSVKRHSGRYSTEFQHVLQDSRSEIYLKYRCFNILVR